MPAKLQSVADCYDQTSLVEFERSEDPAMVNAVEKPSASKTTGSLGEMQRTEARSHRRNNVPVKKTPVFQMLATAVVRRVEHRSFLT